MAKNKDEERKEFLNVYREFNEWLGSIGFKSGDYKETATSMCYHYTHYDKHINSLYGVEMYKHKTLPMKIYFMRDRNEHKFMFVGSLGSCSEVMTLEKTKELILTDLCKLRDEFLSQLDSFSFSL